MGMERHRPGPLKQQNKQHKHGRHRSKGAVAVATKGKVSVKQMSRKNKNIASREERRNQTMQNRLAKRFEMLTKKRELGSATTPPFLVAVVTLANDVPVDKVFDLLAKCDQNATVSRSSEGILHINVPRWKQRFSFMTPEQGNMFAVLDCLKVADTVLFVASALSCPYVDEVSQSIILSIIGQGLPSTALAVVDLENLPLKKRAPCKQEILKAVSHWFPDEKVMALDKDVDALNLLRKIGSQKQRTVLQRDGRPHLLAEHVEWCPQEGGKGVVKISGYLRKQVLFVNSLIHIPGWGDFQLNQIDRPEDPYPFEKLDDETSQKIDIVSVADPAKRTSLDSENIPDPMDAEQTWPTQEELNEAKKERKIVKKIPKGMSDYQACWIPDDDGEEAQGNSDDDEDDEEEDEDMDMASEGESSAGEKPEDEEEFDLVTVTEGEGDERYDEKMDLNEEERAKDKLKEAKLDQAFPDEVDTPMDMPAKERFQKYRGLSSFRTSPWDPKENLPSDYARIFQFENFARTKKRVMNQVFTGFGGGGAVPGHYITVYVDGVPEELVKQHQNTHPLVVYGLLEHEHKMSVINMVLKRTTTSSLAQEPIKSKERLVFHCGYRRYSGCPIFSQHTNGSKHKYERFFQPDSTVVATLYAPIIYPPATVLVLKEKPGSNDLDLVASGSVLSVNPDRLVIKRAVLSGHPFKVNKKSAIVRFMFFNREDINWFKPVELRTKYGRRGHIKEPLGTHGHMKTVFDGQLKSQDTVLMSLYKRVFPKWSYEPAPIYTRSLYRQLPTIMEQDEDD